MYEDGLSSKEKEVFEALKNVIDPELGVSLVDLFSWSWWSKRLSY